MTLAVPIRTNSPETLRRAIAITGIPGSGKSTLAVGLAKERGWTIMSTGDIARAVDPDSLGQGGMADEAAFQAAFHDALGVLDWSRTVVLDGIPRSPGQVPLLPSLTTVLMLTVRPDIARDRLLRRGRPDDQADLIARRVQEQSALLDVEHADGWAYRLAGWHGVINTSQKRPTDILHDVLAYLDGRKREAF